MKTQTDGFEAALAAFVVAVFGFLLLLVVDNAFPVHHNRTGVVIGKSYTPFQTSTSDEQWSVQVTSDNAVFSAEATVGRWAQLKSGDIIEIDETTGGINHTLIGREVK